VDIYVTDLETGDRLQFPMLPESITMQTATIFQSYTIMAIGDVKLPAGEELVGVSWDAMLPGEARDGQPYVAAWRDPKEIQRLMNSYRNQKKKLRLMVTETPINHNVYLSNFSADYKGGYGDYFYTISFVQAKDLKIYISGGAADTTTTEKSGAAAPSRPQPPKSKTHTVVAGDTLYGIAQKHMNDGNKYPQLYAANTGVIDPRNKQYNMPKYTIYPGQVLTIP
jgi:hypothetical protein